MKSTAARKPASSPWRYREQEQRRWLPLPGMQFQAEGDAFRLFSPLIAEDNGLLLDDILQLSEDGQFHLMGASWAHR